MATSRKTREAPRAVRDAPDVQAAPNGVAPIVSAPEVAQPAFQIVATQVALHQTPQTNIILYGDVAKLSTGRLRCRHFQSARDGTQLASYGDWSESDPPDAPRNIPTDWPGKLRSAIESRSVILNQLPPPDVLELERFIAAWPVLSARLGIKPDEGPKRHFDTGPFFYPASSFGVSFGVEWWRSWLTQHAGGNFGAHGAWTATPLSPDVIWTLSEQSVEIQNQHAASTRSGSVRSRFLLDANLFPMQHTRMAVTVITAFSRRGNLTLGSIEALHESQGG